MTVLLQFALGAAFGGTSVSKAGACYNSFGGLYTPPASIDYQLWGQENRANGTILLIPGLGGNWQTFELVGPALARHYQVLAYSQAGHGGSLIDNRRDFSNFAMALDLDHLLTSLNIESAHILGHSLGTRTAIKYASLFPEKVKSVILDDHEFTKRKSTMPDYAITDLEKLKTLPREFADREAALRAFTELIGSQQSAQYLLSRKTVERNGKLILTLQPFVIQTYKIQSNGEDLGIPVQAIKARIFLMLAASDYSDMTPEGRKHLDNYRPDLKIVDIQCAEHSIHWSNTNEFLDVVRRFIDIRE